MWPALPSPIPVSYTHLDVYKRQGGKAKLDKIDVVPNDFGTPLEVFEQVAQHERRVSEMIDELVDVASAEKDKATQDLSLIHISSGSRGSDYGG